MADKSLAQNIYILVQWRAREHRCGGAIARRSVCKRDGYGCNIAMWNSAGDCITSLGIFPDLSLICGKWQVHLPANRCVSSFEFGASYLLCRCKGASNCASSQRLTLCIGKPEPHTRIAFGMCNQT